MNNINKPKVSIIIPTYNVESFLLQCLTSIAEQTYKNIECIIIIDGATDQSFDIAKSFCEKDNRFSVYWQENAGSGPARNNGIKRSSGEFVMFVDPDDWCRPDYVENMLRLQQEGNYDMVITGATKVFFNNGEINKSLVRRYTNARYIGYEQLHKNYASLFSEGYVHGPHCKIFKSSLIKDYNIVFPDLRRSQDIVFNYRYYDYAQSVLISDYVGYMYRVIKKERTKRLKPDYYITIGIIYNDLIALHKKWGTHLNKRVISTTIFGFIYALLESNILKGLSINYIVNDNVIKEIILNARPQKIHLSIVRFLLLNNHYKISVMIIKLILNIKLIK